MRVGRKARLVLSTSILGALIIAGVVAARPPGREGLRKPRASVVAMLSSANSLDLNHAQQATVPGPTDGLVSLRSIRGSIQFLTPRFFAERDAWGQELLYWSDGYDYMILSYGADGQPEFDYGDTPPYAVVPPGGLTHEPEQDIVIVNGRVLYGPAFESFGRSTMLSIRAVATAVESYAIDNNDYPLPTNGAVPASLLEPHLMPTYTRHLPTADEWGNPLLYWSNVRSYAVISTGADGVEDQPYSLWQAADFDNFEETRIEAPAQDIVLIDYAFVQWPRATRP